MQTGTIVSGSIILGAGYLTGLVSSGSLEHGQGWMLAPIVGPFGAMLSQDLRCPDEGNDEPPTTIGAAAEQVEEEGDCAERLVGAGRTMALLFVDGLVQFTGAAVLLVGLASSEEELVRDRSAVSVSWFSPHFSETELGLSVGGRF